MDKLDEILIELADGPASNPRKPGQVRDPEHAIGAHTSAGVEEKQEHHVGAPDDYELREDADLAILVALPEPELAYVLKTFSSSWRQEGKDGVVFKVGHMAIGDRELKVVAAAQNDMGMVPAAILATKTISAWNPSLLAMVGICAGVKDKVALGDVVIGQQFFDYGSGKLDDERLLPDYTPVPLSEHLCSLAKSRALESEISDEIRRAWPGDKAGRPSTELQVHVGAMASGAAVVADDRVVADIEKHKRSLLAVDMESYGLARAASSAIMAPNFLVVKGVQDFADAKKNDVYREYAAFASALWLHRFVCDFWSDIAD